MTQVATRNDADDVRRQALAPIFEALAADERGLSWLANYIPISRQRLWRYKMGYSWPPEWVIQRACARVGIDRTRIPAANPTAPLRRQTGPPPDAP